MAAQLQQRIVGPLDLGDTKFPATEQAIASPYLHGYAPRDEDWLVADGPAGLLDVTEMDPSWAWAAGAMVSSTPDLAHFYQALLTGQLLDRALGARRGAGGLQDNRLSTKDADRQLVATTNLNPEPEPRAAQAAVDNLLRRQVSC